VLVDVVVNFVVVVGAKVVVDAAVEAVVVTVVVLVVAVVVVLVVVVLVAVAVLSFGRTCRTILACSVIFVFKTILGFSSEANVIKLFFPSS
jgi:hypothetical protein